MRRASSCSTMASEDRRSATSARNSPRLPAVVSKALKMRSESPQQCPSTDGRQRYAPILARPPATKVTPRPAKATRASPSQARAGSRDFRFFASEGEGRTALSLWTPQIARESLGSYSSWSQGHFMVSSPIEEAVLSASRMVRDSDP
jgi:hypothetical protein